MISDIQIVKDVLPAGTRERAILIDDDPIINAINKTLIRRIVPGADILVFTSASQALRNLESDDKQTVIFLDVNMPVINGWDFLTYYEKLAIETRKKIALYFISASVDPNDRRRALNSASVKDFLVKPITEATIRKVIIDSFIN